QKSLEHYNTAIALKPKLAEAYMYRGVLYTEMGRKVDAQADLAALQKLNPQLVTEPQRATIDWAEKKDIPASMPILKEPADEIPSPVLVPQTFRLPQRLIEDLVRAGELRALSWLDR